MEDEEHIFYQSQLDFFGEHSQPYGSNSPIQSLSLFQQPSLSKEKGSIEQQKLGLFRAYNPLDQLKNIPEERHQEFMQLFNNHKTFNGIQHFFSFGEEDQHRGQFLQNIQSDALRDNTMGNFELDKLFLGENKDAHRQLIQSNLLSLHTKFNDINHKIVGSINLNKTITNAFYQHFQNFTLVLNSSNFFHEFQENFKIMTTHCKKLKGPSIDLVGSLYQFWIKSFKDLISEIWKYSSKFTLNFFKKNQPQDADSYNNYSNLSDIRSQSSNTMGSKDKRKGWTKEETDYLLKCIDSNIIFTQSVLKTLATQFNRSASSVSSKIQKIIKSKKGDESQQDSLLKKAIEILKMYEQGQNRQTIIQKINEHYEMGYGGQWEKSVGQLLSSKKQFIKIRGKHRLLNPHLYKPLGEEEDRTKLTFKDKVVHIFLGLPNYEGDLRTLVDRYSQLFGQGDSQGENGNEQRRKTIEGNISKTLSRYDIFDNSNGKTKYLLNPLLNKPSENIEMEVENFLNL